MRAFRRAILMKVDPVVSLHAHRLFSGRACSCKKDPCCYYREYIDNINYMYIFFQADTEEGGLSYYQMRQPGTTY